MKSLEEVIKYKLNFLPEEIEPFYALQTYTPERGGGYTIYRTKNTIFSNDSFSLMEDITPLFIYISSCDKYYRENGYGKFDYMVMELKLAGGDFLRFGSLSTYDDNDNDLEEHRIAIIKNRLNGDFSRVGYCTRYTKPFTVILYGVIKHFLTDEERLALERLALERRIEEKEEYYYEEDYYEEELSINDSRTFKLEQCVICLEKEPKVLFCNCGHICICDECFVKKFDNCPVCKKENAILRMIE